MEHSIASKIALLPIAEQEKIFSKYTKKELDALKYDWNFWGRPKQLRPIKERDWDIFFLNCGRYFGKLLDKSLPINTLTGWKTLGEVLIGDTIYDEQGKECQITNIFEAIPKKSYRFWFDDGSHIDSCSDHFWATLTHQDRKQIFRNGGKVEKEWVEVENTYPDKYPNLTKNLISSIKASFTGKINKSSISNQYGIPYSSVNQILSEKDFIFRKFGTVKTTQEIVDSFYTGKRKDFNHSIPMTQPLEYKEVELPIDPYVLGVWLGDGHSADSTITQHENDSVELRSLIEERGYPTRSRKDPQTFSIANLQTKLRLNGLLNNKHIPELYLRSSIEQRLELLRGLMDTDATCSKGGHCEFTQSNSILAENFRELITSLGIKFTCKSRIPKNSTTGLYGKLSFRFTFTTNLLVFNLTRKKDRLRTDYGNHSKQRMIVAFEEIPSVPMRCLAVNSPNRMFLIGKELIPTHNSRAGSEYIHAMAEAHPGCRIALVAPTAKDVRDVMVLGKSGLLATRPKGHVHYKKASSSLVWKNGSIANMLSADEPDRIRGYNFHYAWFDEISSARYIEAFDMLRMTLREGIRPQLLVTSTPKVNDITLRLLDMCEKDPSSYILETGSSYENVNAPESFIKQLKEYEGTPLGQQEIFAVVNRTIPGALWRREWFKYHHAFDPISQKRIKEPEYIRTVIAVDIAVTANKNSDFTTICVASETAEGDYMIREIEGLKTTPTDWSERIAYYYDTYKANTVVVETNQGGDLVEELLINIKSYEIDSPHGKTRVKIKGQDIPVKYIKAHQAKRLRAEPVSFMYQKGRVRHLGVFPELESQMVTFTGKDGKKDDYVDAAVYAILELSGAVVQNNFFAPIVGGTRATVNLNLL